MRIALAQINLTVGDLKGNVSRMLRWVDRARKAEADLIAFPELAISGYPAEDLLLKPRFLDDCRRATEELARKIKGIAAVVGFPHAEGPAANLPDRPPIHNSAALIARGRILGVGHKVHLPNYGVFDEKRYFTPGRSAVVADLGGVRVGVSVCEDMWQGDVPAAQVSRGGARMVLNISSSPFHTGKGAEREALLKRRAQKLKAHVAYVNLIGGQDELVFDGQSMVLDPEGNIVARAGQFKESLLIADIDVAAGRRRPGKPTARTGRLPVDVVKTGVRPGKHKSPRRARIARSMDRLEEVYSAIVLGTRDYVRKNRFKKVVIGLSGGIDSALVAALAADALGKDSVVGVSMPSRYSSPGSIADAASLAANLGIQLMTADIERAFEAYLTSLKPLFKGFSQDVAEENIQARIRGNILMALSNKFGWLVLTTGNKSELAVGYCTLYGDLAGGFAILKDVPKTLVYELAAYRNSLGGPAIPGAILAKPPSAELKPDQTDQDSLPPYEVLDPVLGLYVVEDMAVAEIAERGFPRPLVRKVARLVDGNEYKRRQGPPGIKITPRAFGKDRRMPITNRYR